MTSRSIIAQFLQSHLDKDPAHRPIIFGLNGPQGGGKTWLASQLAQDFSLVFLSMDDLYLTRAEQAHLAAGGNPLLEFRGLPGTHSLELGTQTLTSLKNREKALLPRYDKSLCGGLGDRLPQSQWETAGPNVDIVLFEGWSLGFRSLTAAQLDEIDAATCGFPCTKDDLADVNRRLKEYEKAWYPLIDVFCHLQPLDISYVFDWRWEQEETLRKTRGDRSIGLDRAQVRDFVSRFMPCYNMYLKPLKTPKTMSAIACKS
ncbi:hypothetical protein HDV03_000402 [Kappamyces sp. JEL0829]|nr:hypothetical protein HDV03_000402 [Kappamyces sp. JEL0829]